LAVQMWHKRQDAVVILSCAVASASWAISTPAAPKVAARAPSTLQL
jgi:hypothetical protein